MGQEMGQDTGMDAGQEMEQDSVQDSWDLILQDQGHQSPFSDPPQGSRRESALSSLFSASVCLENGPKSQQIQLNPPPAVLLEGLGKGLGLKDGGELWHLSRGIGNGMGMG